MVRILMAALLSFALTTGCGATKTETVPTEAPISRTEGPPPEKHISDKCKRAVGKTQRLLTRTFDRRMKGVFLGKCRALGDTFAKCKIAAKDYQAANECETVAPGRASASPDDCEKAAQNELALSLENANEMEHLCDTSEASELESLFDCIIDVDTLQEISECKAS